MDATAPTRAELDRRLAATAHLGSETLGVHSAKEMSSRLPGEPPNFAQGHTVAELMRMELPVLREVIPGFVPEGAAILAGPSKAGKTFMSLGLAGAVASNGRAFGAIRVTDGGRVLYLALEDNRRRMKKNIQLVLGDDAGSLDNLHIYYEWPRMTAPGSEPQGNRDYFIWMARWMKTYPDTRLIITDTFKHVRPIRKRTDNIYNSDYEDAAACSKFANQHRIGMVFIHHRNQGKSEDTFTTISGSEGINAGFDTLMVLKRAQTSQTGTLEITGRDVMGGKHAVHFDFTTLQWTLSEHRISPEREQLLEALRALSPLDMGYTELAAKLGKSENTIKQLATKLFAEGRIHKRSAGRYYLPTTPNASNGNNASNGDDEGDDPSLLPLPTYRDSGC